MSILYIKALHIIFVVTWFAGLFYIVRLFIYDVEAKDKPEPERRILSEQFRIMQKKIVVRYYLAFCYINLGFWPVVAIQ